MKPRTVYLRAISREPAKGSRMNAIVIDVPGLTAELKGKLPLWFMFRALGIESDRAILSCILGRDVDGVDAKSSDAVMLDFLRASVVDGNCIYSQRSAVEFLKKKVSLGTPDSLAVTLSEDFLPQAQEMSEKAILLGYYVRRFVRTCIGVEQPSDRDSFLHKRVSTTGFLLNELFRLYYEQFRVNMEIAVDNEYNITHKGNYSFPFLDRFVTPTNKGKLFQEEHIGVGMNKSFKGQWGTMPSSTFDRPELGVVQDVSRISYMSFLSHLRRVATPLDGKAKVTGPHKLSSTQFGIMCPCESPDGRNVGLLKNLALLAWITDGGMREDKVVEQVQRRFEERFIKGAGHGEIGRITAFVNEVPVGVFHESEEFEQVLSDVTQLRDEGAFGERAAVSPVRFQDERQVHIRTDDGRICRPLTLVETNKIVYLDVEEINSSALIAMTPGDAVPGRHTHIEIHPAAMFSVYSSTIPYADHNQSVRNSFSSAQGKQAIGVYATNFNERIDTAAYFLHYAQRPLVETSIARILPAAGILNNGENVIVAIACYSGYNMEDAVILNAASVDRGMFNVSIFKSIIGLETKEDQRESPHVVSTTSIIVAAPGEENADLDSRGLPKPNTYLDVGKVAIGRTRFVDTFSERSTGDFSQKESAKHESSDASIRAGQNNHGFVDRVFAISSDARKQGSENSGFCKVRVRKFRTPELGDKMASRHGQKGVVGAILPAVDMPFTSSGIVPDMIVNPHAFPSRMTIGHLIESIAAKSALGAGVDAVDATAFEKLDVESYGDELVRNGYQRHGNELMYNGLTGEQMQTEIFVGPTYYLRLKHMVADKINSRGGNGKIVGLTGQPTKGRANGGGMRLGEMERDGIVAHGMSAFMKESFIERSDGKKDNSGAHVVDDDGHFSFANPDRLLVGRGTEGEQLKSIGCPAAFKLFSQELNVFHIDMKLETHPQ